MTLVRLVILGRQGAGKGTQCAYLSVRYGVAHISTGDMLRDEVSEGTELGRLAKLIMDRGELVPDEVMVGIVDHRLHHRDALERGFLLDGFPRTVGQAEQLLGIVGTGGLDLAINLDVPREVVLARIAGRRICGNCGAIYHVDAPPSHPWVCDVCGGPVTQRDDDREDAVQQRLELYEQETAPLIAWFDERGLMANVDGLGEADEVAERMFAVVDKVVR